MGYQGKEISIIMSLVYGSCFPLSLVSHELPLPSSLNKGDVVKLHQKVKPEVQAKSETGGPFEYLLRLQKKHS